MKIFSNILQAWRNMNAKLVSSMLLMFLPGIIFAQNTVGPFADWPDYGQTATVGSGGSDEDVTIDNANYTVHTPLGLAWIAWVTNNKKTSSTLTHAPAATGFENCTVTLDQDIDLADATLPVTDKSWIPIGGGIPFNSSSIHSFKGTFNGNGYLIKGLTITSNANTSVGLFGYTEGAQILNLGVELSTIGIEMELKGGYAGALAGYMTTASSIENCYTTGSKAITIISPTGGTTYVGGIAGKCDQSNIKNCYSTIDITVTGVGGSQVGGIISRTNASITNCLATGVLKGKTVGGIAGSGIPTSCLALNPTIKYTTGGYYYRVGSSGKTDALSYATAKMQVYNEDTPATFIPSDNQEKHGHDCYTQTPLTFLGDAWDTSGDNLPRLKIKNADGSYSAWPTGLSQPSDNLSKSTYLSAANNWFQIYNANVSTTNSQDLDIWIEEKNEGNIYHVRTALGLAWINYVVRVSRNSPFDPLFPKDYCFKGNTVILDNDINLTADYNFEWLPIGYAVSVFKGIFDGNSHTISNMIITKLADETKIVTTGYIGLFGDITNCQIKNLTVEGSITLTSSSFPNKYGTVSIFTGGIAGGITNTAGTNGSITNCASSVKIDINDDTRDYYVGGIIGSYIPNTGTLDKVYSTEDIKVTGKLVHAGGIAGENRGTISNCYSTSNIDATGTNSKQQTYAGGLVGFNYNAKLQNGFATGSVKATNTGQTLSAAGGICGNKSNTINCLALNKPFTNGEAAIFTNHSTALGRIDSGTAKTELETNYASTMITLQAGSNAIAIPSTDKKPNEKNGADVYLENYRAQLETAWNDNWTFSDTNLPQLKGSFPKQPQLPASTYLATVAGQSLKLPNDGSSISISNKDGQWSYKDENNLDVPFNGTIESSDETSVDNTLTISTSATSAPGPALTFQNVHLTPSKGTPLTINNGSSLSINVEGSCSMNSSDANALINNGILSVIGDGTLSLSTATKSAISNAGTLCGNWMEWQFETVPTEIAIAATDKSYTKEMKVTQKNFATVLPAGKAYTVSKKTVDEDGTSSFTRLQGNDGSTNTISFKSTQANGLSTFTGVKDAVSFSITKPDNGGSIYAYWNEQLLDASDVLPDGATIKLVNDPLPGHEFENYSLTGLTGSADEYIVENSTTSVTVAATFKKKEAAPIEEEEVKIIPPTSSVDKPTGIIPDADKPTVDPNSTIKLIKSDLEEKQQDNVEKAIQETTSSFDELVYADIALVEVTNDGKMIPIQPKEGSAVTLYYPYPDGTDKSYTFTIVHLRTDGTTETFTVAKGNLENTNVGLKFNVTSFSPFGIAWKTKSSPDPTPETPSVFYTVTIPAVKGLTTDPIAGSYKVEEWSNFSFYLTLSPGYDQSTPVITTDRGETIEPRTSDGKYIIKYIRTDLTINIDGIVPNIPPVANAVITSGTHVWTEKQMLCFYTDIPAQATVIDLNGQIKQVMKIPTGETKQPLSSGVYIVRFNNKAVKILVP